MFFFLFMTHFLTDATYTPEKYGTKNTLAVSPTEGQYVKTFTKVQISVNLKLKLNTKLTKQHVL